MAYTRLNLSDGEVFNASHVSHIEDGIEDCETQLSEVNQSLTDISTNVSIPSNSDINDYTTQGRYVAESTAKVATFQNAPTSGGFILFVINFVSPTIFQLAIENGSSPNIFIRRITSNGAGSWKTVA